MALPSFVYDPYNQVMLPACCGTSNCDLVYDPNTGELYPLQCEGSKVLGINGDQQVYCLVECE